MTRKRKMMISMWLNGHIAHYKRKWTIFVKFYLGYVRVLLSLNEITRICVKNTKLKSQIYLTQLGLLNRITRSIRASLIWCSLIMNMNLLKELQIGMTNRIVTLYHRFSLRIKSCVCLNYRTHLVIYN